MAFSESQHYERIVEHSLIWACQIHGLVIYQAFFCLFFELANNEEGLDFSFLDSLNLYKKEGKASSFTCILHRGINSFLLEQSTSFEFINSWVLVLPYLDSDFYSSSWLLFQLYGESINVSYIVDLYHLSSRVKVT